MINSLVVSCWLKQSWTFGILISLQYSKKQTYENITSNKKCRLYFCRSILLAGADERFLCCHGEAWDANSVPPALKPPRCKASIYWFRSLELLQNCWTLLLILISSPKALFLFSLYFVLLPNLVLQYCSSERELVGRSIYRHSEKCDKRTDRGKAQIIFQSQL